MTPRVNDIRIGIVGGGGDAHAIQDLEARPIDSLWAGGHIASRNPSTEAMVGLVRLATLTERVRVGTSILLLPLYPPALVAKQIADLDRATGGRLILGVGIGGEYPQEFSAVQVPIQERGRRMNEAIPLLRKLWTAEPVTHDGHYYPMRDVRIHPAPAQPGGPPIIVAGRKEPAMRRAALIGDGWFPYLYSPRRYATSVATIRETAADAGRDLSDFDWCVWVFLNINPDGDTAREEAARTMGGTYNQDFRLMIDKIAAAGTAGEVTAKLQSFYDAGARHFIFLPATAGADQRPMLDRLFADVVPLLREYADRR
ncbi:MAG: TIGR03619 family F420-dependent LLM class oxidoreductase [Mycolicibacterium cosmeticum]|nr:TIGR03619 family F420-dependent LLM class oxidoreductase [Mycolicibacterium cosmeticum]